MSMHSVDTELTPEDFEPYRRELTGYCYRMLGSGFEADDAVQETLVRAWKNADTFEGRSSVRSWVYRIATNVCLDMLRASQRRARPMEIGRSGTNDSDLGPFVPEHMWVTPIPDARVLPDDGNPADLAEQRETIKLAFVAALQHLPPKQRAVLILREVLRWQASEVAELLGSSVQSVNSALQRARATLDAHPVDACDVRNVDPEQEELLAKYVDAFQRYDINELVHLLADDAIMSMPPFDLWIQGSQEIVRFFVGQGAACEGSILLATSANGCAAFGSYKPDPNGGHAPWSLQVIETKGDKLVGHHNFLYPELFEYFGLPAHLD